LIHHRDCENIEFLFQTLQMKEKINFHQKNCRQKGRRDIKNKYLVTSVTTKGNWSAGDCHWGE
jgi:hypothetical protein